MPLSGQTVMPIFHVNDTTESGTGAEFRLLFNNNVTDATGNHTWTNNGPAPFDNTSPPEGSHFIDLNASSRSVESASSIEMGSLQTYVFHIQHGTGGGTRTIMNTYDGSTGVILRVDEPNDDFNLICIGSGGTNNGDALDCGVPSGWYNLILTLDFDNGYGKIYLDGTNVSDDTIIETTVPTDKIIYLGEQQSSSWLYGDEDAVQGYKRIFTPTERANVVATPGEEQFN